MSNDVRKSSTPDVPTFMCITFFTHPQDGLTRQQLDIALLVAEAEPISGLPPYPSVLPISKSDEGLTGFQMRRVECMCSSHTTVRADLLGRLQLLEVCALAVLGALSRACHDQNVVLDAQGLYWCYEIVVVVVSEGCCQRWT